MKYKLLINLPQHKLKKGTIFEWNKIEHCYTTKLLVWFSTPLIERKDIRNQKWFKKVGVII